MQHIFEGERLINLHDIPVVANIHLAPERVGRAQGNLLNAVLHDPLRRRFRALAELSLVKAMMRKSSPLPWF